MFLLILIWVLIGAALGWRFGSHCSTSRALTLARQQMGQEIRYWQDRAERSQIRADQLAQDRRTDTAEMNDCA